MQPNNYAVDRARINRRVHHSALTAWMMRPGILALGMLAAVVGGFVYLVSLWLSFPVLMFWAPVLLFADWQMPMRMPTDMGVLDPSTKRQVPGKLWGLCRSPPLARRWIKPQAFCTWVICADRMQVASCG